MKYPQLEKDGLDNRKEYQQVPPKVEYSLTQMGRDLKPAVQEIHKWNTKYNIQGERLLHFPLTKNNSS